MKLSREEIEELLVISRLSEVVFFLEQLQVMVKSKLQVSSMVISGWTTRASPTNTKVCHWVSDWVPEWVMKSHDWLAECWCFLIGCCFFKMNMNVSYVHYECRRCPLKLPLALRVDNANLRITRIRRRSSLPFRCCHLVWSFEWDWLGAQTRDQRRRY